MFLPSPMEFKVSRVDKILIMKCSVFRGTYLIAFSSSLNTVMEHPWPYRKFHSCADPDGGRGPTPLKIHKLYGFLLKIAFGSPTLEKVGPLENGGPPGLMIELPLKPGKNNFL